MPRPFWECEDMLHSNPNGSFPYSRSTNLLYGFREAITMLLEEGLDAVFARHRRHGEATRAAVRGWGLELVPLDPREYSNSLTAIMMPQGCDAEEFRNVALEKYDISLGTGLGKFQGKVGRAHV